MPPKKQQKLDKPTKADDAAKSGKSQTKGKLNSTGKAKSSAKSQTKGASKKQRGVLAPTNPLLEAAAGAGIKTTEELQEITRITRAQKKLKEKPLQDPNPNVEEMGHSSMDEGSNHDSDDSSSSSSSDEDTEGLISSHSGSKSSSREISPDDPVRRKIPFDRERGDFHRVEVSPGSLEQGTDVRQLGKLQEILLTNPEAVSAIDSMLQVIKAMRADEQPQVQQQNQVLNQITVQQTDHRQVPLPAPPPIPGADRPGMSETTIYTKAVPSASPSQIINHDLDACLDRLVVGARLNAQDQPTEPMSSLGEIPVGESTHAVSQLVSLPIGTSTQAENVPRDDQLQRERQAAKARTDEMILEAERQKLHLERPISGKRPILTAQLQMLLDNPGSDNLECDNKLYGLSVHLDDQLVLLIEAGQFVDFSKLIPTDKVVPDDEPDKLQLVNQGGRLGVTASTDKDVVIINSFKRWELAYDVYAGVYTRAHPKRGPEMLEYKHVIRRASDTYVWANVYAYDKIHRHHMEKNPGRTWAKKHRDAWSDHVKIYKPSALSSTPEITNPGKKRKYCKFFNKNGKCIKGSSCEYDHRCSFCGLFGHGRHNCRKLAGNKKETPAQGSPTMTPSSRSLTQAAQQ